MTVQLGWDDEEKTIIRYDLSGRWTWDEFWRAYGEATQMMEEVEHTVYFITNTIDTDNKNYLPPNFLSQLPRFYRSQNPKAGITVIIHPSQGQRQLTEIFGNIITKLFPQISERLLRADTLEEARQLITDAKIKS